MSVTVAVDAMSGDLGVEIAATAIKEAIATDPDLNIIAVGQQIVLQRFLQGTSRVAIHAADEVIAMDADPLRSIRRYKSSMFQAVALVKDGAAAAALSAGNTGALMGMARIQLKMQPGFSRPAIASFIPCDRCRSVFCMLDLGANLDRSADMLVSFALLGNALARVVLDKANPRVGLLNVGKENLKGGAELLEAGKRLAASELNFIGNVEANSLYSGIADVVVCDGFTGNVFLKTMEGLSGMIRSMIMDAYTKDSYAKLAGLVSKPVLGKLKISMDARRYNGAAFLGLQGLVVKSHGSADVTAFRAALDFSVKQARNDLVGMIGKLNATQD